MKLEDILLIGAAAYVGYAYAMRRSAATASTVAASTVLQPAVAPVVVVDPGYDYGYYPTSFVPIFGGRGGGGHHGGGHHGGHH